MKREPNRVINQPDSRVPGSSIYAFVAEDLLFHGVAYGQIMSMYADGRIQEWTRVSPDRVTYTTNANNTEIIGYSVDGTAVPSMGIRSLVVFNGLDEQPNMEYVQLYMQWRECDHVLRSDTHFMFCETIKDAEYVEMDNHSDIELVDNSDDLARV